MIENSLNRNRNINPAKSSQNNVITGRMKSRE